MHPADRQTLEWFARTRDKTAELAERIPDELLNLPIEGEIGDVGTIPAHPLAHCPLRDCEPSGHPSKTAALFDHAPNYTLSTCGR